MKLGKIVTVLLAGFLALGSLHSVATTKSNTTKTTVSTQKETKTEKVKSVQKNVKVEKAKPAQKSVKVEKAKPAQKSVKVEKAKPAQKSVKVEKAKPAQKSVKIEKAKPAQKSVKVEKAKPAQKSVKVEKAKPAQKNAKAEKLKSVKEQPKNVTRTHYQTGIASYYADKFNGRLTANGEIFSNAKMTAAHRTLPFGTLVEVTNLRNGRSVVVRINDRGPYVKPRVIDLSKAAANRLGMHNSGLAKVKIVVLNKKS